MQSVTSFGALWDACETATRYICSSGARALIQAPPRRTVKQDNAAIHLATSRMLQNDSCPWDSLIRFVPSQLHCDKGDQVRQLLIRQYS